MTTKNKSVGDNNPYLTNINEALEASHLALVISRDGPSLRNYVVNLVDRATRSHVVRTMHQSTSIGDINSFLKGLDEGRQLFVPID